MAYRGTNRAFGFARARLRCMQELPSQTSSPAPGKTTDEKYFLEGPHSRAKELRFAIRVFTEFIRGFRALHFVGPCVTVFGSARFTEGHPFYALAREVGARLTTLGLTVMTGGGPGVMEAANRGAREAGGHSVGCNIKLPKEQKPNPYVDKSVDINHFFVRKVLLFKYSYAFVILPGGFGTMDECFEALTLIQTGKINNFPVVIMGKDYWRLLRELTERMVEAGTVSKDDLSLVHYTDCVDEVIEIVGAEVKRVGLKPRPEPSRILGERKLPFLHGHLWNSH